MDSVNFISLKLETADAVEFMVGEDTVESIQMQKNASCVEISVTDEDGITTYGYPWSSIKSFSFTK